MRTLVARFAADSDLVYDRPLEIRWDNGGPASLETYRRHRADTRTLIQTADGMELRLYPEITGDVRFDAFHRLWFVVPVGGEPLSLDLRRPDATDLDLRAALFRMPVFYKARIHR